MEVVSLHPLIGDWAKQVGGDQVKVIDVVKLGTDIHAFKPGASEMRSIDRAKLILASGKNMELYLDGLRDALKPGQAIVEVGRTIPSQKVSAKDAVYSCCPHHDHDTVDPHWWHNVKNAYRAVKVIEDVFSKADPENKAAYEANAKVAVDRLKTLDNWVKVQVASIPKKQRHLVTAHSAFGYFCKAYGFKATFVQGLTMDGEVPAKQLATSIRELREIGVKAIFPETLSNPKVLKQIAAETGAKIGKPLIADGAVSSYEEMIRGNVSSIIAGLGDSN